MKAFLQSSTLLSFVLLTACGTADMNNTEQESDLSETSTENTDQESDSAEENLNNISTSEGEAENTEIESNADENDSAEKELANDEASDAEADLKELEVHFIDAGQADATWMTFEEDGKDFNILFDTGNWNNTYVYDYLSAQGVNSIDIMIGSHPHADHIGQMDVILDQMEVEEVWLSGDETESDTFERVLDSVMSSDASYEEPRAGESYKAGPLEIDIVNPDKLTGDLHDGSISALFTYGKTSFLFTGDAETETEASMISRGHSLEADVLKLGHHGSSTSTSSRFLQEVSPRIAIVSAGEGNQYGHPHTEVIERVEEAGIDIYATYAHGTIVVTSDGETLEVTTDSSGNAASQENADDSETDRASSEEEELSEENSITGEDSTDNCIDINHASMEELQDIHEIGPARAQDIKELRPFETVEELTRVNGIGEGRIDDIKSQGLACTE